tara:strand:+ start:12084 stop:15035 length:2952 start_codon:yes stop_codon:yes gene_type:complete
MSVKRFRFVSPGIFLNEIDNSQIPQEPEAVGPAIIGRSRFGPAMTPIRVDSFTDYLNMYGRPIPGNGGADYRAGNFQGPTYGPYAAQAYLAAGVSPVNYVRLLGVSNPNATSTDAQAGFTTKRYSAGTPTTVDYGSTIKGGSLGLFIWPSGSTSHVVSGSLAAVFYLCTGSIVLTSSVNSGTNSIVKFGSSTSDVSTTDFTVMISSNELVTGAPAVELDSTAKRFTFNFNRDSNNFIRKVLNTNPILTNDGVTDVSTLKKKEDLYWLGETYETTLSEIVSSRPTYYAALLPLELRDGTALNSYHEMRFGSSFESDSNVVEAKTGWFFSQDLSSNTGSYDYGDMPALFRFVGLDAGEYPSKSLKVSIEGIKASPNPDVEPFGSFSVVVRRINDTDNRPIIIERFDGVNLNQNSVDYISARIGDRSRLFDYDRRVNQERGQYDNQSDYIRVEVAPQVEAGLQGDDATLLPFGVFGPVRPIRNAMLLWNSNALRDSTNTYLNTASFAAVDNSAVYLTSSISLQPEFENLTASVVYGGTSQRATASDGGLTDPSEAYFGFRTTINRTSARYDSSIPGALRLYGVQTQQKVGASGLATGAPFEHQWIFSLDDVRTTTSDADAYYESGSRAAGHSKTASGSDGYKSILAAGYDRFTAAFQGGSDGLNIQEAEPFQDNRIGSSATTSYERNTLEVAIDTIADPDRIEINLLAVPGVRKEAITNKMIDVCEKRADAMAIIDIEDSYIPRTESTDSYGNRVKTAKQAIDALEARKLNTSYAACYFPWVQIRDSFNASLVWVPPSVAILGTLASSERKSEVWFAPAGFNRGGLSDGAAGIPVVNITRKLTSKERDDLYQANINPIASFPSEGLVVFGQKTLQVTQSALDRINVRRLMIFVKKNVSRFASTLLFDQNVRTTWSRFKNLVEPFLASVQSRFGLTEYRLVLDETTTTPDLVDRNILYAKIFLKPARSIEFIAVDFVISRSGASFDD